MQIEFQKILQDQEFLKRLPSRYSTSNTPSSADFRRILKTFVFGIINVTNTCPDCGQSAVLYNETEPAGNFAACLNCLRMGATLTEVLPNVNKYQINMNWRSDLGKIPASIEEAEELWSVVIAYHYAKDRGIDLLNKTDSSLYFVV